MRLPKPFDDRKQYVNRCLVGSDQHSAPSQVLELSHRALGFVFQTGQPFGVVHQDLPGLSELASFRGTVEEPLVEFLLEPLDRLADRRLGAVEPRGGAGKAPLGGHGEKHLKLGDVHRMVL